VARGREADDGFREGAQSASSAERIRGGVLGGTGRFPPSINQRANPRERDAVCTRIQPVAVPLRPCEKPAMMWADAGREDTAGTFS
jgi:hypothetical protein